MSVSNTEDPVQTVIDILEDASATYDAAGSAPEGVEPYEATDFSRKQRRDTADYIYVVKQDVGTTQQIGARSTPYLDEHAVRAEAWVPNDSAVAHQYARDMRDIANTYNDDNKQQTAWTDITAVSDDDLRGSARAKGVDHHIHAVTIQLRAARE